MIKEIIEMGMVTTVMEMAMEMIRITETIMAGTSIRTKTRIRTKAIAATMVNT